MVGSPLSIEQGLGVWCWPTQQPWLASMDEELPFIDKAWLAAIPHPERRQQSDLARRLARHLLQTMGLSYRGVGYVHSVPQFVMPSGETLSLSWSHCEQYLLLAWCTWAMVGCDIQPVEPRNTKVVSRILQEEERAWLQSAEMSTLAFALKESAWKCGAPPPAGIRLGLWLPTEPPAMAANPTWLFPGIRHQQRSELLASWGGFYRDHAWAVVVDKPEEKK